MQVKLEKREDKIETNKIYHCLNPASKLNFSDLIHLDIKKNMLKF